MSRWRLISMGSLTVSLLAASQLALGFSSGSTGADGAFNPTESQTIQLPPSGVFNYTSVNIPSGVTITYKKNASNTPVVILASGDVTIAGKVDVSATSPAPNDLSGAGVGGPGGYDGGRGGQAGGDASAWVGGVTGSNVGRSGVGPGAGAPGRVYLSSPWGAPAVGSGGGGAYGSAPAAAGGNCPATPGAVYGNLTLLPLVGGSGGGGGTGGSSYPGSGGGGGGGAILIAASGTINVTGSILANGGVPAASGANGRGGRGGGGSGGAIRLVATTITGEGTISAIGGAYPGELVYQNVGTPYYVCSSNDNDSRNGGGGRIRLESETLLRTTPTSPLYVGGTPSILFVPGMPTLSIASIGGLPVPSTPSGTGDVVLTPEIANPVTVVLTTTGVTVGSSIKLTVMPAIGPAYSATSAPTTGTTESAAASVSINIPNGQSVLQASVTYTVVASAGNALSVYAQGERVEKVRLSTTLGGASTTTLITVSGKEYAIPANVLAKNSG